MRMSALDLVGLVEQAKVLDDLQRLVERMGDAAPADTRAIVDFFDVPTADAFDVPPLQAIEYFKGKGLKPSLSYADMLGKAHDQAFTVAKMMDVDLLGQVKASLELAQANGTPFKQWADTLMPQLQAAGWWGKTAVVDPATGQMVPANITPWRLETIFRTNMQTAYAAGQWEMIESQADVAPYLMYDAVDDFRTRPLHAAWDGTVLPVKSKWWATHYPPNGYNCRCSVIQLDAEQVKDLGLKVAKKAPDDGTYTWTNPRTGEQQQIPKGIDPGFNRNAGKSHVADLKKLQAEKISKLDKEAQAAAKAAQKKVAEAVAKLDKIAQETAAQVAEAEILAAANLQALKARAMETAKQLAAQDAVDAIAKGKAAVEGTGAQYKVKALAQLKKGDAWPDLSPVDKLAAIEAKAVELKAANELASKLANYKKAVLAGKTPAPGLVKAFESLTDAEKGKVLAKIDAEKAAQQAAQAPQPASVAAAVPEGAPPNTARLVQTGGQAGSNEGGFYTDQDTGAVWYVKWPSSLDNARNEVLAAKLYRLAGAEAPELHQITFQGRQAVASRVIDGLRVGTPEELQKAAGTFDHFVADAWLANWDVIGMGFDNLKLLGKRAVRVDPGGALRYRAQGGLKGSAFGDTVGELDSLRQPTPNRQAYAVFGNMTAEQIEDSAVRVLSIPDDQIRAVVREFGPLDPIELEALEARLLARKADIARRYPNAARRAAGQAVQAEAPPPPVSRVTDAEQKAVEDARVNGFTFQTDGDQIEDHTVLVHTLKRADGTDATRGFFKLRPEASRQLLDRIADSVQDTDPSVDVGSARDAILAAVKSINYRADKGQAFDATVVGKVKNALATTDVALRDLAKMQGKPSDAAQLQGARAELERWRNMLATSLPEIQKFGPAKKVGAMFNTALIPDRLAFVLDAKPKAAGTTWKRITDPYQFQAAEFERSFAKETNSKASVSGVSLRYEATLPDGTRMIYFPHDAKVAWAMQGVVKIDAPGKGAASTSRVFGAIEEIGVDGKRADEVARQHLYLNGFANIRLLRGNAKARADFDAVSDTGAAGVQQKLAILKKATGVDVEKSEGWKMIDGVRQAFGHGRAYQLRPDLDTPDFQQFEKTHAVYHNPQGLGTDAGSGVFDRVKQVITGGGMVASLVDRVRRGVPLAGSSVSSDLQTGGADYTFTRLRRKGTAGTGIYWKARQVKRMDAITYDGDRFGRTTGTSVADYRQGQDVASLKAAATSSSNETIFKGGLSLFDDLEAIVLATQGEVRDAIAWLQANGYKTWPDGRPLSEVILTKAAHNGR